MDKDSMIRIATCKHLKLRVSPEHAEAFKRKIEDLQWKYSQK